MAEEFINVTITFNNGSSESYYFTPEELKVLEQDFMAQVQAKVAMVHPQKVVGAYDAHSVEVTGGHPGSARRLVVALSDIHHIG